MLQKRIDLGSQPFGLAIAGEDLVKGTAVVLKNEGGQMKAYAPATQGEADAVVGFVTFRIEEAGGADKDFDVIKAGKRLVVYTLVKNNMWGTTQFVDHENVKAGAGLVVDFSAENKGKLRLPTPTTEDARPRLFEVYAKNVAGAGYTDAMVDVLVK